MIKIIINPQSAQGKHSWEAVLDRLKGLGISYDLSLTDKEKQAGSLACQAFQKGFKDILVMGGDGTLNEVINGLRESTVTFGVVPIGCGNDFAKMLGIRTIEDGIKSIVSGRKISVDLGLAGDRYFVNNVGIGLEAHVVYLKTKLKSNRGQTTYLGPALKAIFTFSCFEAELESKDFTFKGKVSGISIGNGQSHGGIFRLTPNAKIDDGLLDICIIKETAKMKRLTNVWKVIKGTHLSLKEVVTFQTDSLIIRTQNPVHAHTDGELFDKPLTYLEVKVLPKKLQFFTGAA